MIDQKALAKREQRLIAILQKRPDDWLSRRDLAHSFGGKELSEANALILAALVSRGVIEQKFDRGVTDHKQYLYKLVENEQAEK